MVAASAVMDMENFIVVWISVFVFLQILSSRKGRRFVFQEEVGVAVEVEGILDLKRNPEGDGRNGERTVLFGRRQDSEGSMALLEKLEFGFG